MRAVAVVIHWVGVVIDEVVPMHIVYLSVAIVVDTVSSHFAGIAPSVGGQVGMVVVEPCVNDGDHYATRSGCCVPSFRGVDVGVGEAA